MSARKSVSAQSTGPRKPGTARTPTAAMSKRTIGNTPRGGKVPSWILREKGFLPIGDYGVIGDCRSLALVGVDGSIDWCCLPRFDSPSLFGRLLDDKQGGSWQLSPAGPFSSRHEYSDKTNILRTIFQTVDGLAEVTDFMPIDEHDLKRHARPHEHPRIVRMVTGLSGKVRFRNRVDARPDYGRGTNPLVAENGTLHGDHANYHFCIHGTIPVTSTSQEFTVHPGETVAFTLAANKAGVCGRSTSDPEESRTLLRITQGYWWKWINKCSYRGPYEQQVQRSALVLKLLTYAPTGAIVAAPTTSLPEWIGGDRNWDYRYTWLRDASFTLYALFQLGFYEEATDFMEWLRHLTISKGLKILYNLDGRSGGTETELVYLSGYRQSQPVRVGNGAENQLQLDVFGELLDTIFVWALNGGRISRALWPELRAIINTACDRWEERDAGLWEVRGEYRDFTYSKVMCWVAVDRGLRLGKKFRLPMPDRKRWEANHRKIHAAVVEHGFSRRLEAFTQSFGSDDLDASALRLVQLGFLPNSDRRLRSTIDAVDAGLSVGPLVYRYRAEDTDDGFTTPEGSFIICAFWLADALAITGDLEQAQRRFERLLAFGSPLGLFSEEVDPTTGALLGNFPQAFSHLSLISAAVNIERRRNNTLVRNRGTESMTTRLRRRRSPPADTNH